MEADKQEEVGGGKRMARGSRAQVWHGTAKRTPGGLTKRDLFMNKHGRIVSRRKHLSAKKEMRLVKHGYGAKKGKFGFVRLGTRKSRRSRRRMRGGADGDVGPTGAVSSAGAMLNQLTDPTKLLSGGKKRKGGMRGGMNGGPLSPADYDGKGVQPSGNAVQFAAGMGN